MSGVNSNAAQASLNSRCNVFAGSDIGYLKGITFSSKVFRNLNTVEKLNKKMGISCLCWGAEDESLIYAGCKGGDVIQHSLTTGMNQFVLLEHDDDGDRLKEICVHDSNIITAFTNGSLYVHKVESEGPLVTTSKLDKLQSLSPPPGGPATDTSGISSTNLQCMDHNKSMTHMLATGGQENQLRIWDINNLSADPIFVAKNVRNDWLNLRVPVWVTKAKFYPNSNKVITGTGQGTVRMYDPSIQQRRPVIEVKCEEYPVTGLAIRPNSDFQVFVGNTVGTLVSIDLRNKSVIKAFKGNKGGVTDIKCHSKYPVFAVCSADRYVRCYDPDKKASLIHSFYVNSSLNCILFSSKWEKQDYGNVIGDKTSDENECEGEGYSGKNPHDLSDDEGEDLWKKMEVVKSKKRRVE